MAVDLRVYVTPRSGRDEITGRRGDEVAVRVTVPPEGGKANAAVCRIIAKTLHLPKSAVSVKRGGSSRHKILEVDGRSLDDLREAFAPPS